MKSFLEATELVSRRKAKIEDTTAELLLYIDNKNKLFDFNVSYIKDGGYPNPGWESAGQFPNIHDAIEVGVQWLEDAKKNGYKRGSLILPRRRLKTEAIFPSWKKRIFKGLKPRNPKDGPQPWVPSEEDYSINARKNYLRLYLRSIPDVDVQVMELANIFFTYRQRGLQDERFQSMSDAYSQFLGVYVNGTMKILELNGISREEQQRERLSKMVERPISLAQEEYGLIGISSLVSDEIGEEMGFFKQFASQVEDPKQAQIANQIHLAGDNFMRIARKVLKRDDQFYDLRNKMDFIRFGRQATQQDTNPNIGSNEPTIFTKSPTPRPSTEPSTIIRTNRQA